MTNNNADFGQVIDQLTTLYEDVASRMADAANFRCTNFN